MALRPDSANQCGIPTTMVDVESTNNANTIARIEGQLITKSRTPTDVASHRPLERMDAPLALCVYRSSKL